MENLVVFLNSFMEYVICFLVFVACIGVAVFCGIKMRKAKNAKAQQEAATAEEE